MQNKWKIFVTSLSLLLGAAACQPKNYAYNLARDLTEKKAQIRTDGLYHDQSLNVEPKMGMIYAGKGRFIKSREDSITAGLYDEDKINKKNPEGAHTFFYFRKDGGYIVLCTNDKATVYSNENGLWEKASKDFRNKDSKIEVIAANSKEVEQLLKTGKELNNSYPALKD